MARCEVCGNDYDKTFAILVNGKQHFLTVVSVRFTPWLRHVPIADVAF